MNKILLFVLVLAGSIFSSYAQTQPGPQLSIGGEFGLPTGQASQVYGAVVGASVKLELPVSSSRFSFVITGGISDYLLNFNYTGIFNNATYIPVEVGGKYYFSRLGYFEADFGLSSDVNSNYSSAKNAFIYAPIIGFSAPGSKHKGTVDIGLRYEGRVESGGTISQVALRAAYRFGLKKRK
jgi:hypothetical protein